MIINYYYYYFLSCESLISESDSNILVDFFFNSKKRDMGTEKNLTLISPETLILLTNSKI